VPLEHKNHAALAAEGDGLRSILEEQTTLELQHVNAKLLLNEIADLDPVIPVFHSWIQNQIFDELLLDVADYRHVKDGPGIILIGHEADYCIDQTDGRLGFRYNRKAPFPGSNQERLEQAMRSALSAIQHLEGDQRLEDKLSFNGQDIELSINDRQLAPNTDSTRQLAGPELQKFADRLLGTEAYWLTYGDDPRRLFRAHIRSTNPRSAKELLQNLNGHQLTL
jgi:hypothetical protein